MVAAAQNCINFLMDFICVLGKSIGLIHLTAEMMWRGVRMHEQNVICAQVDEGRVR